MLQWSRVMGAVVLLATTGCATAYRNEAASSITGGGLRDEGPGHLVRIGFSGNGYTSAEKASRFTLYRAAEYARAHGKRFFLLYPTLVDAARNRPGSTPTVGMVGGKPIVTTYVLLVDGEEPEALDATPLLEELERDQGGGPKPPATAEGKDRT